MTGIPYNPEPGFSNHSLCHLVIGIPCLSVGGTERQMLVMVKVLTGVEGGQTADHRLPTGERKNSADAAEVVGIYRVTVVCYFECDDRIADEFRKAGAEVILLKWARSISSIRFISRLSRVFRDLRPDVVHIQYMTPGLLPVVAARLAGMCRIIATVNYPGTVHGLVAHLFLRLAQAMCIRFFCVSESAEKSWFGSSRLLDLSKPETMNSSHVTIHNTVDTGAIDAVIRSLDTRSLRQKLHIGESLLVGTVSRLSAEKGLDVLIKAFAEVHNRMPAVKLLIVGSGPEKERLAAMASSLGIDANLVWIPACSWEDAIRYISIMDVAVVPSRYEGFGLVAAEAMACSKPVVASRVDGLTEVIGDGGAGALIPCNDMTAFSEAILKFLSSAELRKNAGRAGRIRVEKHFNMNLFSKNWRAICRSICSKS